MDAQRPDVRDVHGAGRSEASACASVDVPDAKRTRYGPSPTRSAALKVAVAVWPSAPVAVAVNVATE